MTAPEILYRDQTMIAINKPAGLLVHRSAIDYYETHNAQECLQQHLNASVFPVHRIDKPTSGVLLFALNKESAAIVSAQFAHNQITKRYNCVVRGFTDDCGTIDNPVRDKDAPHKPRKPATSHYTTLADIELPLRVDKYPSTRYSLVEVRPVTGRRHQIRQHMKHINHPLIGDTSYGKTVHNRFFKNHFGCERLLLHAKELTFLHPDNGTQVTVIADNCDTQLRSVLAHEAWRSRTAKGQTQL